MVVNPKMAQPIELDEEPIDLLAQPVNLFSSIDQGVQKPYFSSRTLVQPVKIEPQPIEIRSRSDWGPVEAQWSPAKH